MKVILSIKPEFALKIFDGSKKFEFRRTLFKNKKVKKIVVYASQPISKVIGEFDIEDVYFEDLELLWNRTSRFSGITEQFFNQYFDGKESGYAIKVKNPIKYNKALNIEDCFGMKPPQSFAYLRQKTQEIKGSCQHELCKKPNKLS